MCFGDGRKVVGAEVLLQEHRLEEHARELYKIENSPSIIAITIATFNENFTNIIILISIKMINGSHCS